MKPILITIAFLAVFSLAKAQQTDTAKKIFYAVEQEPMPAGGMDKFFMYLQANTRYPDNSLKKKLEGKVFVTFVVEENGSLTDVKILRGVSPDIDAEAIRVVSNAPKWKPGIQNGRAVRVQYNMAISFKLPEHFNSTPDSLKIYTAVEHMPEFPGGTGKFYQYIKRNLKYPDSALKSNIGGNVYVTFTVERDGSLTGIKVLSHVSPEIDAEAIRLMQECPKWSPGMQNGYTVRVQYGLLIDFKLPK